MRSDLGARCRASGTTQLFVSAAPLLLALSPFIITTIPSTEVGLAELAAREETFYLYSFKARSFLEIALLLLGIVSPSTAVVLQLALPEAIRPAW